MYTKMLVTLTMIITAPSLLQAFSVTTTVARTATVTPMLIKVLKDVPVSRSSSRNVNHVFTSPDSPTTHLMACVRQSSSSSRYIKIKAIIETDLKRNEPFLRAIVNQVLRAEKVAKLRHDQTINVDQWTIAQPAERSSLYSDTTSITVTIFISESEYARMLSEAQKETAKAF